MPLRIGTHTTTPSFTDCMLRHDGARRLGSSDRGSSSVLLRVPEFAAMGSGIADPGAGIAEVLVPLTGAEMPKWWDWKVGQCGPLLYNMP